MSNFKVIGKFLRIQQWYKNVIIFLPLVFSLSFFSVENFVLTILGFIALCVVSSFGYVKNDLMDINSDRQHPTKKQRPIASGMITKKQALVGLIILITTGLGLSFFLDWKFGIMTILLIINTEVYSRWLKKILFLDILSISGNFIIRALSGVVLIQSPVSPWLILGIFFVALFLAVIKRRNEVELLKESAVEHREVFKHYTVSTLNSIILISAIMVITTYSLYSMNSSIQDWRLVITVPIVVYIVFRQIHLAYINHENNVSDNILKDRGTAIAVVVYAVLTFILLYYAPSEIFA